MTDVGNTDRQVGQIRAGLSWRDRLAIYGWRDILDARISIATKLTLSFLLIIVLISALFVFVGIRLIGNRTVEEAQEKVRHDLNAAREIYLNRLNHISTAVRYTADRHSLQNSLRTGSLGMETIATIHQVEEQERLDVLTVTDANGTVLMRTSNPNRAGDNQSDNALVAAVLDTKKVTAATAIISREDLELESPLLARRAYFEFIDTPRARPREENVETAGMMLMAAAPIFDEQENLIGILYGGSLLNRDYDLVDKIKETVYEDLIYDGTDIGTATIFQDDVRISTNVKDEYGSRAIRTRVSEEVYNRVIREGEPWIGRAYVVNNWYITAYEPIRNINAEIIGMLYVGILEQKYVDIRNRATLVYLGITLVGAIVSMVLSYLISKRISVPIKKLVSASRDIAQGNLDTRVKIQTGDELGELADTFNSMASALKERDERLREFTTSRIMESERLALVGQLSANVAHELNNPLQGIVTYSHLLLEEAPGDASMESSIEKIVAQANRCRDIIRGLLDFSRQRKPDKTVCDINSIMEDCVELVENQALFMNIQFQKRFEEHLPTVIVDPSQFEQVIMNLLINAAEAMDGRGRLTLATRYKPDEGIIELEFTDTGHGIPEQDLEKIFDPFFTTKEVGHGTGLGLAITYGIIKEHNSTISVQSEVGEGTSFFVRIPVA